MCCLLRQVRTGQYVCHLSSINPQHGATLVSNFSIRIKRQTPIGARTAPPLKGTRFRKEQERVWMRERGRWTKVARGRLGSWRDPSQLTASHSILRDRPQEINLPTFHGNTRVKHAPPNPRVKLYPQGGKGEQPPALCDTDNCNPPPKTHTHTHTHTHTYTNTQRVTVTHRTRQSKTTFRGKTGRGRPNERSRLKAEWELTVTQLVISANHQYVKHFYMVQLFFRFNVLIHVESMPFLEIEIA